MTDPTLDAIRARVANTTSTLWMNHAAQDITWLLERYDASEAALTAALAHIAELEASTVPPAPAEPCELRMNAYYYAFDATGVRCVDVVLSAVACAGKANHHTDAWTDECEAYHHPDVHRGEHPVAWIQNAANDAAAAFRALHAAPPRAGVDLSTLSPREREVVDLLASGVRLSEVAKQLGISRHTARNHCKQIFRKLGVHSQVELLAKIGGR